MDFDTDLWSEIEDSNREIFDIAELVEALRQISDGMSAMGHDSDSWFVARAAYLLERLSPPSPVSSSLTLRVPVQALPEAEDVTDTLTVTTDDGTTETITVTITGTNDAARAAYLLERLSPPQPIVSERSNPN